jgi:hypothetical protein
VGLTAGLIIFSSMWISIYAQLPVFKISFILAAIILFYGINQVWKITKILGCSGKVNKRKQ